MRSALKRKNYKTVRESDKNKEQKMKKMLLLLASLACFGLLASCSDETQDVYLTNNSTDYYWVGTVSGSITLPKSSNYDSATITQVANLSYKKDGADKSSNTIVYTIAISYTQKRGTNSPDSGKSEIEIAKIGDKYYDLKNDYAPVTVTGSLEDSEFTITSVTDSMKNTISSLKFTRL